MSRNTAPAGITWGKASKELKDKIKFVLQQAQNNRYSVSRIYAAHNAVFDLKEEPQTCSTCLTTRVKNLRKWWGENAKEDTTKDATPVLVEGVQTTGEKHIKPAVSVTYEDVLGKYGIEYTEDTEGDVLNGLVNAGIEASGMDVNEFSLIEQRYGEHVGANVNAEMIAGINDKLGELGIEDESTSEEKLEAYEVLAAAPDITDNERAFYAAQIEIVKRSIEDAGKTGQPAEGVTRFDMGEGVLGMDFTPSADNPNKGTILNADGSKVAAGTYKAADGKVIAVQVGGKATIKE